MRNYYMFIILWILTISTWGQKLVHPTEIKHPVSFSIIKSLKNKPIVTDFRSDTSEFYFNKHEERKINTNIHPPKDFDVIYQGQFHKNKAVTEIVTPDIIHNFSGGISGSYPPDTNGSVNENYYFQVINTTYTIYNKQGNILAGPSDLNSIFDSSLDGTENNDGDPIVLWDEQANKWFFAEFSITGKNDYMLIAVSQTDDPTGAWWSWSFDVDDTPDYMKFGIWQDGYYMATNTDAGNDVYVFERDKMIIGDANPIMIGFDNPNRPETFDRFHCILPLDNDGDWAPTGTPGQFITIADDNQNNPDDELWIYEMDVDWNTPSNSTFQRTQTLTVSSFVGNFDSSWDNIPQPGTDQELDAISTVLMFRANYRNFNGDQRLVVTHTIAESEDEAAIRWYELQNNGNRWSIRQEGNINPDNVSRWNASIAINANKEIGIGFSVSDGNNTYPGIRIMGQTADENANATGVMNVEETVVLTGANFQTGYNRWGDYCNISVDPVDGRTFWYTNEYVNDSGSHDTKIVAFKFSNGCDYPDNQASNAQADAQSETQIDVSWTRGDGDKVIVLAKQDDAVDSNPVDGTSYTANAQFGSGDEIGNGNYVVYIGTGTSVSVTGLTNSTTYHFAVYEFNDTDFCYLTPSVIVSETTFGLPIVETKAMLQVNVNDAQGQGEVVSENGSAVTERGLCWSTSPDPTTADAHDSNGSGEGTYTVDLTGLTANTTYYVRAYAINSSGTAYGDNVSFTTDSGLATVTTGNVSSITTDSAEAEGEVTDEGAASVTERGICWSTSLDPTTADSHDSSGTGTGTYTIDVTGLTSNTTYYARAYAINSYGTSYGDNVTFKTLCGVVNTFPFTEGFEGGRLPDCWTNEYVTDTQDWTYEDGGHNDNPANAHSGNYNALFYNGSTNANVTKLVTPTLDFSNASSATLKFWHVQEEWSGDQDELRIYYKTSTSGDWVLLEEYVDEVANWTERVIDLPNLSSEYYVAFEATGQYGYGVGVDDVEISIVENNDLPEVTTGNVTSITTDSATAEGEVTDEGSSSVTERGICWNTSPNPTTADTHDSNGTGIGTYSVNLTGLTSNTTYYVRAYAINSSGTSYGDNISFTTASDAGDCVMIADYPYLQTFDNWTISNPGDTCTPDGSVPLEECWENVSGDDSDWDIYSGSTTTTDITGPTDDITGGGNYIYMESSGCRNKTASVITPHFNFSDVGYPLMYFYVHMYRFGIFNKGTLNVYYSTDNGVNWVDLNEFSGNQGDAWFQVYNDLGFLKGEADVIFKFTINTNNLDIAIDHFEIIDNLYCPTEGSIQYDTATTAVQFNTINNADGGKTESYADYTNINTTVQRSQSYDLTARVDTDGNYTVYTKVWIDWNQDYDFDDPGEEYDLGDATDVSDGATSNSPLSVLVPADAVLGKTRMRVSTKYGEYATACETDFDGEVEDYTIFVSTEDCSNVAFWKNSQWTDEDENVLATTDLTDRLLFIDEILITNGTDIDACSMIISKNTSLIISASDEVKLTNDVYNEGQILIENTGALIQTEDDAMVEGDGEYEMQIQSQPMNNYYDYGFWSAPIETFTLGGIVPNAWGYYAFNPTIQYWEAKDASTVMEKGVSYAVSAPEGFTGGTINVNFKQDNTKFNAGDVSVPLTVNGTGAQDDDDANLVGNPYPSAIDFDKVASNNTNIQGAYYVWTNCAGLDADGHHQPSGFAVYSTGSGSTAACEGESNEVNIDQYIASGQGFYVEANASGNLVFKNSQRVTANNTFVNRTGVYDRVWLDFSNNAGFSQTLVGFFDNATDQLDRLYDAHLFDKSSMSLYSLSGKDKLIIQGLSSWDDETREVPLGFNTVAGGSHTISLHEAEGVLRGDVNIYLKDLYESKIIDLKQNAYDFSAEQGNYDDRFVLIFTRSALKVDPIKSLEHVNILSEQPVFIAVSDEENIEQVDIYVLSGKKILSYKAQQPEKRISMNLKSVPHQVLIFKISLKNQKTVTIKSVR